MDNSCKQNIKWNVVHDFDDDNGKPTLWEMKLPSGVMMIIEHTATGEYVAYDEGFDFAFRRFHRLDTAKIWVHRRFVKGAKNE